MIEAGINLEETLEKKHITISNIYKMLRKDHQKVHWRKLICNNGGMPKWTFILYMAILGKMNTRDRLARWGVTNELLCPMCKVEEESLEHMFFKCSFTAAIWSKVLQWMGITRQTMEWSQEIEWTCSNAKSRSTNSEIYRIALASCVYHVWQERNHKIFQHKQKQAGLLIKQTIQMICGRSYTLPKLRRRLEELNFYP
ncbi:uncharacterized protein LOC107791302 [Nicotiana tabacum]|uniref:Uncharacterized protein LOC107791302 n=2 Tax=Nicotiana TaxID=4085 RepID=A0A1S3ZWQ6_TOBAC|nr:PREDICTED: uncharacterized protein LOC104228482 [Nicotiana sylvestris]XP_016468827.1 PREDICTED: uncharacterized protein LOC107791302 [Nicotiana tabacum]